MDNNSQGVSMAQSALDMLGVSQETVEAVEPEEVYEGGTRDAGLYKVAVDKIYIRKTDSGASMLEADFKLEDGTDFHYSTCVKSGDQKGNKTTYTTKQGKERALPGVESMTKLLTTIDGLKASAVEGDVEHFGTKIKALCFTGLQGKKLQIGVNQYENFYNGEISVRNDIKYWLDENGKNSAGEDLIEKVVDSLEKFPLKKIKLQASQTATTGAAPVGGAAATKASGW